MIPADFLIGKQSPCPLANGLHHRMLIANCLAQTEALMVGKTTEVALEEIKTEGKITNVTQQTILAKHKTFLGNHPTNTIVYDLLSPKTLGALIALYEHKIFVQGVIWKINSFDQWGVELGKQLANVILKELASGEAGNHDSSTANLMKHILNH